MEFPMSIVGAPGSQSDSPSSPSTYPRVDRLPASATPSPSPAAPALPPLGGAVGGAMWCCGTNELEPQELTLVSEEPLFALEHVFASEPVLAAAALADAADRSDGGFVSGGASAAEEAGEPKREDGHEEPRGRQIEREEPRREQPALGRERAGPRIFELTLARGDETLGLQLDLKLSAITVKSIEGGAVARHNAKLALEGEEASCIQKYDFILCVNGQVAKEAILKELETASILKLRLCRRAPFHITVRKQVGQHLGTSLCYESQSVCLRVKELHDGAAKDYNASVPLAQKIQPQDLIISVNGVMDQPARMIEVVKTNTQLELVLIRPP
mmetsp:Transcript_82830/g.268337  ORF Transcript_82830/g.268337 Transcript_82830/m.268337 type:complete len:329 (+) Transcript_82830:102-1088(+)